VSELKGESKQKFSTLPEAPGVVSVMSKLSRTGGTRLSLYAVSKLALKSLDVAKSCKIKVTVQLLDANGNELESSELGLESGVGFAYPTSLILENAHNHTYNYYGEVSIWPGARSDPGNSSLLIATSWTGDVYVDIDTEMLPRLKGCKLSVSMPEFPAGPATQTPTESVGVRGAEQSASGSNVESQSQVAVSPKTMPQSIEVRRTPTESVGVRGAEQSASGSSAESQSQVAVSPKTTPASIEVRRAGILGSDGRGGSTLSPPAGEIGADVSGAKSTPIAVATPEPEQSPVVKNADVVLSAPTPVQTTARSNFVVSVLQAYNKHDYLALSPYLVPGHVNYFGHRDASPSFIRNDMTNDARTYAAVNCTYYPDTLTHEVSNEYSPHWVGLMLYDTITTYTEAREFNGRVPRATTRFTVGYTVVNGVTNIYAMVLKVI
jgi:hypothetical protein